MSTSGSSSETKKMIVLMSSDGEYFEIEEEVAANSQTLKHMIEDECADSPIPLPNVTSPILAKVVEYCKQHTQPPASTSDDAAAAKSDEAAYRERVKIFDEGFVKDVSADQATLFDVLLAANYLNIKSLMDLMCQTIADMIRGKTADEIRVKFNIKNDFTPEQEDQVRKDNAWAFE